MKMPLETAFTELRNQVRHLHETVLDLRVTVVEDQPKQGDVALVDRFTYGVEDIAGWLEEALTAVSDGQDAFRNQPTDAGRACRALLSAHERIHRAARRYSQDLTSYEWLDQLLRFGKQRQGGWLAWAGSVKEGLERCRQPMDGVDEALYRCWQSVTERVGMNAISVQATSIGQVTVPRAKGVNDRRQ